MEKKTDSKGNVYYDVGNVRVTCLGKTWGDSSGVRIQAYVGEGNKLHRGAELPVPDKATAYDIIAALTAALALKDDERK